MASLSLEYPNLSIFETKISEWAIRLSGVAESLEFKGGAIDYFGALFWDIKPRVKLNVRTVAGEIKTWQVQRINHKKWTVLEIKSASGQNFKGAVKFERIGAHIVYLRIDTFFEL